MPDLKVMVIVGALLVIITSLGTSQRVLAGFAASHQGDATNLLHVLAEPPTAAPTGTELHLGACGQTWAEYLEKLPQCSNEEAEQRPLQWTVSGGAEYLEEARVLINKWKSIGLDPVLVVALDEVTARTLCENGFRSVYWNAEKASYSRVADAKFTVSAALAERGYRGFFIEMDVFCRKNPVPLFMSHKYDLVNIGHGNVGNKINIGVYMASPRMGPFFRGLNRVLANSLHHKSFTRYDNSTGEFFDQSIYQQCIPSNGLWQDDDAYPTHDEYFHLHDTERTNKLLQTCRVWQDFNFKILFHHLINSFDPPAIYDSTYCIHPLANYPFTPLAFKLGTAKFLGWDPKPIGHEEKLLKLNSGDFEFANCFNRCFSEVSKHLEDRKAREKLSTMVAAMVEIALATNRTLVLPRHIRTENAFAFPTHAIVDVRTLGVPYRFMTTHQFYEIDTDDVQVLQASKAFVETLYRTLQAPYSNAKVLSIDKFCTIQVESVPQLQQRAMDMKWCLVKEQYFTRSIGAWDEFCGIRNDSIAFVTSL